MCPAGKSVKSCPAPLEKIFLFFRTPNQNYMIRVLPHRGALAIVIDAEQDAVDADALSDEQR
jgi:hypothetical protein